MENMLEEIFDTKDEVKHIINELDNHIGLNKAKETLQNIERYYEVFGIGRDIKYTNYNIIISVRSLYNLYEDLIEIIRKMYIFLGIISNKSKYLYVNMNNDADKIFFKDIKEEMIIIDILDYDGSYSNIKYQIETARKENPEKIYIILENEKRGKINSLFIKDFKWNIEINEISTDEKEKYIRNFLLKHRIYRKDEWIKELSIEPFYNVKSKLTNVLVECSLENKWEIFEQKNENKKEKLNIKDKAEKELNQLIGLIDVKAQLIKIINYLKICKDRNNLPMLHMCFNGNPGTGKTTVARILGKIFAEEGFLSEKGKFIEVQRADLIGKYVGQTAPLTKEQISKARGGILFIDEAYTISSYLQDEAGRDYGAECIATLIKGMEDYRNDLCVIFAGYTNEMEHLLKCNPGFESRVQFKIYFPDYNEEELYEIFKKLCKKEKYKISANIKRYLMENFKIVKNKPNFSNARYVRNLFEKVKIEQANRIIKDKQNKDKILSIDVKNALIVMNGKEEKVKKIGF